MAITFRENPASYMRGRRVNAEEWNGISRTFETGSNAQLPFGVPVVAGSGRRGCVALSAAAENVLGITEANQVLPRPGDYYLQHDTVAICEVGVIAVVVDSNGVAKGAQARFNVTDGVWTSANASATVLTIPGAFFEDAIAANSVGPLRYRRPQPSLSASS